MCHQGPQDEQDSRPGRRHQALKDVAIHVDIEHTYIGDLVVTVKTPRRRGVKLHDKAGGSTDNLRKTYDVVNTPGLAALIGTTQPGRGRSKSGIRRRRTRARSCASGLICRSDELGVW